MSQLANQTKILYKNKIIETFIAFKNFCEANKIKYIAAYGTALGAIRHNDIIPWDDDIDVYMVIDDYEKFINLKDKCKGSGYEIMDYHNKNYYLPFAKFINTNTTLWEVLEYECVIGSFIDIFPLFESDGNIENERIKSRKLNNQFYKYQQSIKKHQLSTFINSLQGFKLKDCARWLMYKFIYKYNKDKFIKIYENHFNEYSKSKGNYLVSYFGGYAIEKEIFDKIDLKETISMTFGETSILVPNGYDKYLTKVFGNYMEYPPIEERVSLHNHYFLDLEKGYSIDEIKKIINGK